MVSTVQVPISHFLFACQSPIYTGEKWLSYSSSSRLKSQLLCCLAGKIDEKLAEKEYNSHPLTLYQHSCLKPSSKKAVSQKNMKVA